MCIKRFESVGLESAPKENNDKDKKKWNRSVHLSGIFSTLLLSIAYTTFDTIRSFQWCWTSVYPTFSHIIQNLFFHISIQNKTKHRIRVYVSKRNCISTNTHTLGLHLILNQPVKAHIALTVVYHIICNKKQCHLKDSIHTLLTVTPTILYDAGN